MPASRRLAALTAAVLLGLGGGTPAFAQSAGDEQYQDPLAQDGGGGEPPALTAEPRAPAAGDQGDAAAAPATAPPLAPAAPGPDVAGTSTEAAPTALPNTGSETGAIAAIGAVLVLLGIGLRLRTADARA